jgi:hypothetical protein
VLNIEVQPALILRDYDGPEAVRVGERPTLHYFPRRTFLLPLLVWIEGNLSAVIIALRNNAISALPHTTYRLRNASVPRR